MNGFKGIKRGRVMKKFGMNGVVLVWSAMAAVSVVGVSQAFAGGSSSCGVPNPAAVWCDHSGGKLEYFKESGGDLGICRLERALIDEWTFYRATSLGTKTQATQAFLAHARFVTHPG